ncbi:transcriptional regulator [Marinomonas sp. SBI22]|uniref:Lrp/AsnC family transcriptional regulator n=1 Tax=unclassified Marinomonas TaxID=196814 RepID=UPI0007AF2CFE|nr:MULTISPECIES: Lrp/AsnC family transcriptional regulator [unclassified Marinomonas]KZM40719.1 transcriptional regulator [Marinomonas sp. SBI8L]KZM46096.1 transcriptional regulator [Marinomonas sp. SBI22]
MKLDSFDQKILSLLVEDARLSISDIARQVSLSRSAVTDRIKRLEESQTITGYHAKLNQDAATQVAAYFSVTFSPLCCEVIAGLMQDIPEIKQAHSISGDVDLIVFAEAANMTRLSEIREMMDAWPNVQRIVTHTVLVDRLQR